MIISGNTERGSLKLTRCSCRKKAHETENLSAKERWSTKQNVHLSWSFLLPIVKTAIRRSLSIFFAAGSILLQFKVHLLGKPWYTLTESLLANLTDPRFLFGPKKRLRNFEGLRLCCLAFLASSRPCLSHASMHDSHSALRMKDYYGISQKFLERRMLRPPISRK